MNKAERAWLDPGFKKKLKVEAAQKGMSFVAYTKLLCDTDEFERMKKKFENAKYKI